MDIRCLSATEIEEQLKTVPEWQATGGKLHREFRFRNFSEAFGFMTRAALVSEQQNHHPEWHNVYGRVVVNLVTHECGGISARDFAWARAVDQLK